MARTHTFDADGGDRPPTRPGAVLAGPGEEPGWYATGADARRRPTDTQVWNWAESAVLLGYGPTAASFL